MAAEYKRARGRKKIKLPSGDDVYIPAIRTVSFVDPRDRYQEHEYGIDNSPEADRNVHVDDVVPTIVDADGKPTDDPPVQDTLSDPLKVERIDLWKVLDPRSRYQEQHVEFDNRTGADLAPPSFTQHQRTHIYRYFQDPENPSDDGPWIDVELLDDIAHVDSRSRYQETVASLDNPTNAQFRDGDLTGQASEDDPDITNGEGEGTEANPVRLDPFQNIVNWSGGLYVYVGFDILASANAVECQKLGGPDPRSGSLVWTLSYMTDCATGLRYDTTSVGTTGRNRPLGVATGATWTYPGAEFPTSGGEVLGSNTFMVSLGGPFSKNAWFPPFFVLGAVGVSGFAPVTGDLYPTEYADFPGWFDTLSVTVDGWGYPGDGLDYSSGEGDSMVGYIVSPNLTGSDVADHEPWEHGTIISSHTFDFSEITASYRGATYDAVATKWGLHGSTINVLCKKRRA